MKNDVSREQFETHQEYIDALQTLDIMQLERRQLQDLGSHFMAEAAEEEDWDKARTASRYFDLAINMAASKGDSAMMAVKAVMQVLDNDQKKELDSYLAQFQEKQRKKAQNMSDRMSARHEMEDEDE